MRWMAMFAALLAGCAAGPGEPGPEAPVSDGVPPAPEPEPKRLRPEDVLNGTVAAKTYTGHSAVFYAFNMECGPSIDPGGPANIGGACFQLPNGTEVVQFRVVDDVSPDVGVYVRYDEGTAGFFCSEGRIEPEGARFVVVQVWELSCTLQHRPTAPVGGTIELTMYHP